MNFKARIFKLLRPVLLLALILVLALPAEAKGPGRIIIRDAEIENTLKTWLEPLLKVAGMDPEGVHIIIVQDNQINAFVAGGSNIFIYTGLIDRTAHPGEVIGVMAHELGHIEGGHLVSMRGAAERASYESILGAALGIGAAIVTGNGQAANAVIAGSSSLAASRYLTNSRLHESSADQGALRFMQGAQMNPSGLASFFEKMSSEELLPADQQSAYMRTHPLTRDRIEAVAAKAKESPYYGKDFPPEWLEQHARMKAKLAAFINPSQVAWNYDDHDQAIAARYARTIAAYRQNDVQKALAGIDDLLKEEPSNPYFLELKGQMLKDFGKVSESLPYYRKASEALPNSGLIRTALGHVIIESGGSDASLREGAEQLERALRDEPRSTEIHRLLATAYGRLGEESLARLHLAEEAVLQRRFDDARAHAKAVSQMAPGSRAATQAKDILQQVENLKKSGDDEE